MRQYILVSGLCAVLAACGSGGSGGGNPTVNTNPNAPLPTEKLGQFAANRTINFSAATIRGDVNSDGKITGVSSSQEGFGTNAQLNYDAVSGKYGLKINQGGISRTLDPQTLNLNGSTYSYTNGSQSAPEALVLYAWRQTPLNLSYVTYGAWVKAETSGNSAKLEFAYGAGGVATEPGDMPKTGTVTYNSIFEATLIASDDYGAAEGTGTVRADFATGKVESTFTGNASFEEGNPGTFGFTSSASIATGANNYSGTATGAANGLGSGLSGTLSGGFFGPGAAETGGSFRLEGNNLRAVGAFVGSKQ
jgi:hypothetical protein